MGFAVAEWQKLVQLLRSQYCCTVQYKNVLDKRISNTFITHTTHITRTLQQQQVSSTMSSTCWVCLGTPFTRHRMGSLAAECKLQCPSRQHLCMCCHSITPLAQLQLMSILSHGRRRHEMRQYERLGDSSRVDAMRGVKRSQATRLSCQG